MFLSHDLEPKNYGQEKPQENRDMLKENKTCLCLATVLGPVFCFWYFGANLATIVVIAFICSFFSVYLFRTIERRPRDPSNGAIIFAKWEQFLFLIIGLITGVFWVFILANELVTCISVLGDAMNLSAATLGLTILSIGNNLQDLLADVLVHNKGLHDMAVGGIFGTPCFDVMLTLGLGFAYAAGVGGEYDFDFDSTIPLAFALIIIVFIFHMVYLPLAGWKYNRAVAMFLIGVYFFAMGMLVAMEAGHLPVWNTQTANSS